MSSCPDDSNPTISCNIEYTNCQASKQATYTPDPTQGISIYNTKSLYGACFAANSPYPLQKTILSSNIDYWIQNDLIKGALALSMMTLGICVGVYLLALLITCLPSLLVALMPLTVLIGLFVVFYILMVQ